MLVRHWHFIGRREIRFCDSLLVRGDTIPDVLHERGFIADFGPDVLEICEFRDLVIGDLGNHESRPLDAVALREFLVLLFLAFCQTLSFHNFLKTNQYQ